MAGITDHVTGVTDVTDHSYGALTRARTPACDADKEQSVTSVTPVTPPTNSRLEQGQVAPAGRTFRILALDLGTTTSWALSDGLITSGTATFGRGRFDGDGMRYPDWHDEGFERPQPLRDVSVGEILEGALKIEPANWTKSDQMRVGAWLRSRSWERYRRRSTEAREWRFRKLDIEPISD